MLSPRLTPRHNGIDQDAKEFGASSKVTSGPAEFTSGIFDPLIAPTLKAKALEDGGRGFIKRRKLVTSRAIVRDDSLVR
jgi:hypothetical protein